MMRCGRWGAWGPVPRWCFAQLGFAGQTGDSTEESGLSGQCRSPSSVSQPPGLPQAVLHPDADDAGGLACNDKQTLAEMRE